MNLLETRSRMKPRDNIEIANGVRIAEEVPNPVWASRGVHIAYSVTFDVRLIVSPGWYVTPEPSAAVFQPAKV